MPFDWMHPDTPKPSPDAHTQMFRCEILERARLLRRLNYGQKQVVLRIQADLRWEFTDPKFLGIEAPAFFDEVPDLVGRIYAK